MKQPQVIGVFGAERAGKDTFVKEFCRVSGYKHLSFARKLREAAGVIYPQIDWFSDELKDQPLAALDGRTPRSFLIWLGTAGRGYDANVWARAADEARARGESAVFSDCRFLSESRRCDVLIRVVRPGREEIGYELDGIRLDNPDHRVVMNHGTVDQLHGYAQSLWSVLKGQ